ncbi:hypothetical protein TWF481_000174 [Arthrobotrys musiformis]|uniref:Uncharacterized protein n=1 Tax=Arthrobotrys musiformis TaxID=47236 RepID=A0AAV9WM62_9PEZI
MVCEYTVFHFPGCGCPAFVPLQYCDEHLDTNCPNHAEAKQNFDNPARITLLLAGPGQAVTAETYKRMREIYENPLLAKDPKFSDKKKQSMYETVAKALQLCQDNALSWWDGGKIKAGFHTKSSRYHILYPDCGNIQIQTPSDEEYWPFVETACFLHESGKIEDDKVKGVWDIKVRAGVEDFPEPFKHRFNKALAVRLASSLDEGDKLHKLIYDRPGLYPDSYDLLGKAYKPPADDDGGDSEGESEKEAASPIPEEGVETTGVEPPEDPKEDPKKKAEDSGKEPNPKDLENEEEGEAEKENKKSPRNKDENKKESGTGTDEVVTTTTTTTTTDTKPKKKPASKRKPKKDDDGTWKVSEGEEDDEDEVEEEEGKKPGSKKPTKKKKKVGTDDSGKTDPGDSLKPTITETTAIEDPKEDKKEDEEGKKEDKDGGEDGEGEGEGEGKEGEDDEGDEDKENEEDNESDDDDGDEEDELSVIFPEMSPGGTRRTPKKTEKLKTSGLRKAPESGLDEVGSGLRLYRAPLSNEPSLLAIDEMEQFNFPATNKTLDEIFDGWAQTKLREKDASE